MQVLRSVTAALLLIDARAGVTAADTDVATWVRKYYADTAVVVVASKCDNFSDVQLMANVHEASCLGLGDAVPYSAESNAGTADVYNALRPLVDAHATERQAPSETRLPAQSNLQATGKLRRKAMAFGGWSVAEPLPTVVPGADQVQSATGADGPSPTDSVQADEPPAACDAAGAVEEALPVDELGVDTPIKLALVGLPNAGKSTLLNQLLGYERAVTGPEPGLTRDAVTAAFEWEGTKFELVDTAGWMRQTTLSHFDDVGGDVAGLTVLQVRFRTCSQRYAVPVSGPCCDGRRCCCSVLSLCGESGY